MSAKKQTRNRTRRKPRSDFQRLTRRFMSGLLRSLFFISRPTRHSSRAGFVLPTTVLLLLVMTLTVGALSFRTASRTQSTFLAREQQVIDNIAAPAVDRAKAKLEYLFTRDNRMPGSGTPSSDMLAILMRNVASTGPDGPAISQLPGDDPYTLPDEVRININGDIGGANVLDNAWSFPYDLNGDGQTQPGETIAYSVLMDDAVDINSTPTPNDRSDDIKLEDTGTAKTIQKAKYLVTRNGPINTDETLSACGGEREPEQGWLPISTATVEKNFQITAFVSNGKDLGRVNSALELQQVRRASRGNRWGAWFKYDMEIFPGPDFNWNGAIHSDGNVMLTDKFRGHMISSHNSCLYSKESSQITMAERNYDDEEKIDITKGDFQGQLVMGIPSKDYGQAGGYTDIHIFTDDTSAPKINNADTKLTESNDSIRKKNGPNSNSQPTGNPEDIAVDPVALFTQDVTKHRDVTRWERDPKWKDNKYKTGGRVLNQNVRSPYLDDFYRADDRYGPRPNYGSTQWVTSTDDKKQVIDKLTKREEADYDKSLGEEIISKDPNSSNLLDENSGLDGYWERQSINNGMRVVVGQRLELGNANGWNLDPVTDQNPEGTTPFAPPNTSAIYPPTLGSTDNKQKQRVTLRDNLAAVQGMVVYHYEKGNEGRFPLTCIASTSHPGTLATLQASRTFGTYDTTGALKVDFLNGQGTNGWEFSFPAAFDNKAADGVTELADRTADGVLLATEFGNQLEKDRPLGIALRNLAHFAGDPLGGAPSFTPVQDGAVHPSPWQSMWGDYSILRRIFDDRLDKTSGPAPWRSDLTTVSARYNALSPADKSTLHSAACTMSLLAYNIDTDLKEYTSSLTIDAEKQQDFGVHLAGLIDNDGETDLDKTRGITKATWVDNDTNGLRNADGSYVLDGTNPVCDATADTNKYEEKCDLADYYKQFTVEDWLSVSGKSGTDLDNLKNLISIVKFGNQIVRDRALGFRPGNPPALSELIIGDAVGWDSVSGLTSPVQIKSGKDLIFQTSCDPDIFSEFTNSTKKGKGNSAKSKVAFALMICGSTESTPVKYPSLYYLFPMVDHNRGGASATSAFDVDHTQPTDEEYIKEVTENSGYIYKILGDSIAAIPKANDISNWTLPTTVPTTAPASPDTVNPETMNIVNPEGRSIGLSLLDKVMYNGREEMAVRVLDVDLGKLTRIKHDQDYWISDEKKANSGILYAAREDAVREDAIVRPVSVTSGTANEKWKACNTLTKLLSSNCRMDTSSSTPKDPPLSRREDGSFVGISLKPIDFAPDPDRRPYGFRLNANLNGENGDLSGGSKAGGGFNRDWGFTFVTDNAAYIKGEFNPHSTNGTDTIEEFVETLLSTTGAQPYGEGDNGTDKGFYSGRKTLNTTSNFATDKTDRWRVAEVLADSVSILSDSFVDGSVEEGFIRDKGSKSEDFKNAAGTLSKTSFHNQQRPLRGSSRLGHPGKWLRVDGKYPVDDPAWTDAANKEHSSPVPIWVGRNGQSMTKDFKKIGGKDTTYYRIVDNAEGNSSPDAKADDNGKTISGNDFVVPSERDGNQLINVPVDSRPRVNATIISGLVPSRAEQSYGGLHNFPRFLEKWAKDGDNKVNLFIQGAFLQLNFSTAGTAPWDIDAWDPGSGTDSSERIGYYAPPERRWGYDVALQYSPAGPIAQRFVTIERPRSEHYRELPIEDPYVKNLRCAKLENGDPVFDGEQGC
ncbi:MAG: hormogonium polysaccharide biosynthesis protein HpsA [Cyanobacteria bacterium J06581_3]